MSDAQDLKQRFEGLIEFISDTNDKIQDGTMTELENLDQDVMALCQDVENSTPEIAKKMQPLMAKVISSLDELAQNITTYQNNQKSDS